MFIFSWRSFAVSIIFLNSVLIFRRYGRVHSNSSDRTNRAPKQTSKPGPGSGIKIIPITNSGKPMAATKTLRNNFAPLRISIYSTINICNCLDLIPFIVIIRHMHPEIPPEFADVLIGCPHPKGADEPHQRLGEFALTPDGEKFLGPVLANYERLKTVVELGKLSREEAMGISLAGAAATDEEGQLVRAPQDEAAAQAGELAEEAKKKVMTLQPSY